MLHGRCLSYGDGITFWPIKNVITEAAGLTGEESPESAREKIRSLVETAPDADLIVDRVADAVGVAESVPGREARPGRSAGSSRSSPAAGRSWSSSTTSTGASEPFSTWSKRSPRSRARHRSCCSAWRGRTCSSSARTGAKGLRAQAGCRWHRSATMPRSSWSTNLLGTSALTPSVRRRVTEVAEGNPLFVEEMVAMLVDEGLLRDASPDLASTDDSGPARRAPRPARSRRPRRPRAGVGRRQGLPSRRRCRAVASRRATAGRRTAEPPPRAGVSPTGPSGLCRRAGLPLPPPTAARRRLRVVAQGAPGGAARAVCRLARSARLASRAQEFDEILGHHLQQAYTYRSDLGPVDERGRELAARAGNHLGSAGSRAYARGDVAGTRTLLARALTLLPKDGADRVDLVRKLDDARFELGEYRKPTADRDVAALLLAPAARSQLGDEGEWRQAGAALRRLRQGNARSAGLGRQAGRSRSDRADAERGGGEGPLAGGPIGGGDRSVRGSGRPPRRPPRARSRAAGPA